MGAAEPLPGLPPGYVPCVRGGAHHPTRVGECEACALATPQERPSARVRPVRPDAKPRGQDAEDALWAALYAAGIREGWLRQFRFGKAEGRRWRADFAYPPAKLLVEVEGGVHTIRKRWELDVEKAAWAAALGWRVLRCTKAMVKDGTAVELILRALGEG